ncbi:MAG: hypothetical protein K0S93_800 [Nitrososphaeraceae archaeon]|jgi:hypothetical protein|nr:hypothetical protein [Nitrososphaeraceae archaeon]
MQINITVSEDLYDEMSFYLKSLPLDMVLFGLRFAYNRYSAESGGYLFPGRKSLIKKETDMLSKEQAQWRLDNWKKMIKNYREKGYSYPTISRIKKKIEEKITSS